MENGKPCARSISIRWWRKKREQTAKYSNKTKRKMCVARCETKSQVFKSMTIPTDLLALIWFALICFLCCLFISSRLCCTVQTNQRRTKYCTSTGKRKRRVAYVGQRARQFYLQIPTLLVQYYCSSLFHPILLFQFCFHPTRTKHNTETKRTTCKFCILA